MFSSEKQWQRYPRKDQPRLRGLEAFTCRVVPGPFNIVDRHGGRGSWGGGVASPFAKLDTRRPSITLI